MTIDFGDLKNNYVSIAEAKKMSGLRLVLGAYTIPGPWRESCKGMFYVKGLSFTSTVTADSGKSDLDFGTADSQSELKAWTGQSSAPVAIWNGERPRYTWVDQLNLAERLQPEPSLIPQDMENRILMFGLINEIAGENGIAWLQRLILVEQAYEALPEGDDGRRLWDTIAVKYNYSPEAALVAKQKIITALNRLDEQLQGEQKKGEKYLVGGQLSALDIYTSCFIGMFKPMPANLCPMADGFRQVYENKDPKILKAVTSNLLAHRDYIYQTYLELPIVF